MLGDNLTFQILHDLILKHTGLRIAENRFADVLRALSKLEVAANIDNILQQLPNYPLEHPIWQQILANVTIGETYFFRNKLHFDVLEHDVLPQLIHKRRASGQQFLRIWSAGCATGEEPYSIAILLREMLPDIDHWLITILGTDVNAQSLEAAQRGVYRARSFRSETRPHIQQQWFEEKDNVSIIDPVVRRMVNFKLLNLIDDVYPTYDSNTMNMDLIICRNVTIYFERPQTELVVERFHSALNNGGWLLVGHSEPQSEIYRRYETHILRGATFYRKQAEQTILPVTVEETKPERVAIEFVDTPPAEVDQPIPATATLENARYAANQEQWNEALDLLNQLERTGVLPPEALYLRALIYLQQGQAPAAQEALRQAIYCNPSFALAHYTLGEFYAKQNKTKEALRYWMMAKQILEDLEPQAQVAFDDDLTVEALNDLLSYQINQLKV